ncbi:hypothetical protein NEF87_004863 [Candidatus Lokiarchaeum ossiferum]|uniref:CBS domain-containing protein n=1 Tax=Candidatus Lokiarchaeum ossiferum TaxID=2951803 RepID=A0ABY6HYG5_9ARCH|nr:hypothetical protein NEF87_004863 [Candidatus Lokiarchaeum sp. B-35]
MEIKQIESYSYGLSVEEIAHVGVHLVEKNERLINVLKIMDTKQISAVVVEDINNLTEYYIISHTDIIRFLVKQRNHLDFYGLLAGGKNLLHDTRAKEIMRGPIDIMRMGTPIDELIGKLQQTGFKRAILGNVKRQPIGVISTKDLIEWNSILLPPGTPYLVCVMEIDTGLVLGRHFLQEDVTAGFVTILGGSLSAISILTNEILKQSGNIRLIEKDRFVIMLETHGTLTAFVVADRSSITLRRKLQNFLRNFRHKYAKEIIKRQESNGFAPVSVFNIRELAEIFR